MLISQTSHNPTDSHDILCCAAEHQGTHGVTQGPSGAVGNKSVWLWGLVLFIHLLFGWNETHAYLPLWSLERKETLADKCSSPAGWLQLFVNERIQLVRFPSAKRTAATCPISVLPNVGVFGIWAQRCIESYWLLWGIWIRNMEYNTMRISSKSSPDSLHHTA